MELKNISFVPVKIYFLDEPLKEKEKSKRIPLKKSRMHQGRVVRKPINVNLRLKVNGGFHFAL